MASLYSHKLLKKRIEKKDPADLKLESIGNFCILTTPIFSWAVAFHMRTLWSDDPERMYLLSADQRTQLTLNILLVWYMSRLFVWNRRKKWVMRQGPFKTMPKQDLYENVTTLKEWGKKGLNFFTTNYNIQYSKNALHVLQQVQLITFKTKSKVCGCRFYRKLIL